MVEDGAGAGVAGVDVAAAGGAGGVGADWRRSMKTLRRALSGWR